MLYSIPEYTQAFFAVYELFIKDYISYFAGRAVISDCRDHEVLQA
jgi:hypothetical protein